MKRDPHKLRSIPGRQAVQHHPVQRHAQIIALRAVDANHPTFDRAVVAEAQHGGCHQMGPRPGGQCAGQHAGQSQGGGLQQQRPPASKGKTHRQSKSNKGIEDQPRFVSQGKPQTDAQGQEDRNPKEQQSLATCGLQGCQRLHHPPHLATPCAIA